METVTKVRKVPVSAPGSSTQQTRNETYLAQEKVKKKRQVPKTYQYPAVFIEQELSWTLNLSAAPTAIPITFNFNRHETKKGNEHSVHLPQIGLQPVRVELIDPIQLITQNRAALKQGVERELFLSWQKKFCSINASLASQMMRPGAEVSAEKGAREKVEVCLHGIQNGKDKAPPFTEELYQNRFGISVSQWRDFFSP